MDNNDIFPYAVTIIVRGEHPDELVNISGRLQRWCNEHAGEDSVWRISWLSRDDTADINWWEHGVRVEFRNQEAAVLFELIHG